MKTDVKRLALFAVMGLVIVLAIIWFTIGGPDPYSKASEFAPAPSGSKSPEPDSGKK